MVLIKRINPREHFLSTFASPFHPSHLRCRRGSVQRSEPINVPVHPRPSSEFSPRQLSQPFSDSSFPPPKKQKPPIFQDPRKGKDPGEEEPKASSPGAPFFGPLYRAVLW